MKHGIRYWLMEALFKTYLNLTMLQSGHDIPAKEVFKTFKEINQLELD